MPQLITVGQIIDQAWDHYRKHFVELISISAWFLILAALYTISFALYPSVTDFLLDHDFTLLENIGIGLALVTSFIVSPILGFWVFISLVKLIVRQVKGTRTNLRTLSKESWKMFWPFVYISVLFALLIALPLVLLIPGFITILISTFTSLGLLTSLGTLLIIVGLMAAIVLVVRWAINYFFIGYSLILDNQRGKAAFTASRKLIKGRFWPILWRILVPKILFFLVLTIIQFVLLLIISSMVTAAVGQNIDLVERLLSIFNTVTVIVATLIINPLIIIADYLIYESAKANR